MLGVYDYTVILTYLSIVSACIGIVCSFTPQLILAAIICLMVCGCLDAFDGKVARSKPNRTDFAKKFGIQIDSLSDVIAFGVLPACIGINLVKTSRFLDRLTTKTHYYTYLKDFLFVICILYVLGAVIRLAYYNVQEEERQKEEDCNRMYFNGVPVTTAALVFPIIYLIQMANRLDLTMVYMFFMALIGALFVSEKKIPKPGFKHLMIFIVLGLVEVILMISIKLFVNVQ
jgi:CDP-diacylglycerol--serine O-phosphatidyltransferase